MNLLLTNDDGIASPGMAALIRELAGDHTLYVSAPDRQRSAAGASMTIQAELSATPYTFPGHPDVAAYAVSGTPVDCARLGFGRLFPRPDAVISGINLGPNRGTDVLYSGTCSAAQEAAVHGYPALALSLDGRHDRPFVHFKTAAKLGRRGLDLLKRRPLPFGCYYSVNVPDRARGTGRSPDLLRVRRPHPQRRRVPGHGRILAGTRLRHRDGPGLRLRRPPDRGGGRDHNGTIELLRSDAQQTVFELRFR